jgi:hypothetical protein
MITCKNCGHKFEGRYCNHCGQSAKTHRIDIKFLWEDIQHGIIHYDKGIIFTLKQLYLKPGYVIKDYINGKRVHHFRPISLCIVLATIYALVFHLLHIKLIKDEDIDAANFFEKIIQHYYWFVFATIPIFALSTFISFRDKEYNFWEYFILETFKVAQRLLIHIFSLPILYFFSDINVARIILYLLMILDIALIIWTNLQFFNKTGQLKVALLSILSYLIYTFQVIILLVLLILIL